MDLREKESQRIRIEKQLNRSEKMKLKMNSKSYNK